MSYPHVTTPTPNANELDRRAVADTRQTNHRRAIEMQARMLDAFEHVLDGLAREQTTRALAVADERRQYANALHAAQFCAHAHCRGRRSCQGEPADCLRVLLPAIGLDKALAHLIERRKRPKQSARAPASGKA